MSTTRCRVLALLALLLPILGAVTQAPALEWVPIDDPGNPPDDEISCRLDELCVANLGSVPYRFQISKYETTNAEYVEFLNAVAASDPNGLFNPAMQTNPKLLTEIIRLGSAGSYTYAVASGRDQYPVRFIDYFRALRFANWLHNGKPTGPQDATTTEDGAYTLLGANPLDVQRNAGAHFWLVNEDEWYKAAYYDPSIAWYWDQATGSDAYPVGEPPPGGANSANLCPLPWTVGGPASCEPGVSMGPDEPTAVGAYIDSPSPFGTHDQAGNVFEFVEDRMHEDTAVVRGSAYHRGPFDASVLLRTYAPMVCQGCERSGFRLGTQPVPEPGRLALQLSATLAVAAIARRARGRSRQL